MGVAQKLYEWISIDPHTTVGAYIHGYSDTDFVTFSIIPTLHSNEPSGAVQIQAQMSPQWTGRHVDGTVARVVSVTNNSVGPQPYISCEIDQFVETIS
jgi:hypothetical protein